ncbi:geranylgeranyl diphosphate synthase, type II [Caldanaerobius fijiensis DSM 17918]|uniref:Farnesyl diphosphate synthase n=1 Tax=Caldanaerobius fijiensis DSM 17918 TaxID=1121256 RepID=A0A1M4U8D2_9THEO|nr:farnesyl diphosphate synthase [Caldanaerobius fijiensis]SHE52813.1 geranylgeranyl diphosphate synthase, type II [Caldanaerobius fijiensis DSM 17918]
MIDELKKYIEIVDNALDKYLPDESSYPQIIHESMRYSVFAGGKRIRPILCLKTCEMVSGDYTVALPVACAIEMIHTYSLIHDDLPAMDNDDFRRGKPTNHKIYGDAIALLAGDALLTHAFAVLNNYALQNPNKKILEAIEVIAKAAGTEGMIGGQVVDIIYQGKSIDEKTMYYMHNHKTGALIKASVLSGAIIGGADDVQLNALEKYADYLGLAFQIMDDVLDVIGNEKQLGKPVGSDAKNNKCTFVSIYGLDKARQLVQDFTKEAVEALSIFGEKSSFLREFVIYLSKRKA